MNDEQLMEILKCDLEILGTHKDTYLTHLLQVAKLEIKGEGIQLEDTVGDGHLIVMYAAWLYRRRAAEAGGQNGGTGDGTAMPRMLRWALNKRLFRRKKEDTDAS